MEKWSSAFSFFFRFIRKISNVGNSYRCNVCESTFRRFKHEKSAPKREYICPVCHSKSSFRTLWFYLTNEVIGKKNKNKFLYIEPERIIVEKLNTTDISLDIINREYFNSQKFLGRQKLKGGLYDVILFIHQLEYIKKDEAALAELRRLLRLGGFVLLKTMLHPHMDRTYENIVSDYDRDRLKKYFKPGVERVYGINFKKYIENAGFLVEKLDYASTLGHHAVKYYKLRTGFRETIFKCKKL
ncbi:MAG: hypothetical protein PF436_05345 [Prolixibacteraceae bacterium]|jgi:SAM-dependent methyltransferase|nr:hypothetical protein [Prolixibacteraceae bacterium]